MTNIQDQWHKGYLDGWAEQGVFPTSDPTVPPLHSIPPGISDSGQWAYDTARSRGMLDRLKSQAGLSK